MFRVFTEETGDSPRNRTLPIVISTAAHAVILGLIFLIPYLYVTEQLPQVPTMLTFIADVPAPPPPPPPPAAAAPVKSAPKPVTPTPTIAPRAPIEAPKDIAPEPAVASAGEAGVEGGVAGGVEGGVAGGVLGGIPDAPPLPAPAAPVRVGGQIQTPALIKRVEPEYPRLAQSAHIQGIVILEAVVNRDGAVEDVRVLRSAGIGGLLDRSAIAAVRQWRYAPLLLNGRSEKFVLSVTLSFNLQSPAS